MNRLDLANKFKNNDVQGILYLEFLEHCHLNKQSYPWYQQFMMKMQLHCLSMQIDFNQYIAHVISEIRNKYVIMFVFNKQQQVIHAY